MRWKSVVWAGAVGPAVAGCHLYKLAVHNVANEAHVVCTQLAIDHDLRKCARAAWREVRADYPRRAFTAEFRDGFLDGYVDYLDRGGNGSVRATPPSTYTRNKKYYTPDGQCLLKHYLLGFQYGQEVAIATGRRQFLTVPVLLPKEPDGPPAFAVQPPGLPPLPGGVYPHPAAPTEPLPGPRAVPAPGSDAPPGATGGEKPPAPTDVVPPTGPEGPPAPVPAPAPPGPVPALPRLPLPPPPADIPSLPDNVPTPSVLDELPVVAPAATPPPAVPPAPLDDGAGGRLPPAPPDGVGK